MYSTFTIGLFTVFTIYEAYCIACSDDAANSTKCLRHMKMAKIAAIKAHLLEAMNMKDYAALRVPKTVKAEFSSIIKGMEKEERHHQRDGDALEKTFIFAVDPSKGNDRTTLVALFPVSPQTKQRNIVKATLQVFLSLNEELDEATPVHISVKERLQDGLLGDEVASKTVHILKSTRVSVHLRPSDLRRWWSEEPIEGLYVEAFVDGQNVAIHPQTTDQPTENMLLSLQLHSSLPTRSRRQVTPVCTETMKEPGCCLYDLYVDFAEFGWDFILAPQRYNAYICHGDCMKKEPSTMAHTRLASNGPVNAEQLKTHTLNCCQPSEYDTIKIVYLNQKNQMTVAKLDGMIARKCSCS
ncbi:hypothetical protein Aduo_018127 [Ancylostoma duodenale]